MIERIPVTSARSLREAYSVLADRPRGLRVLAGGTDLMVAVNARLLIGVTTHGAANIRHSIWMTPFRNMSRTCASFHYSRPKWCWKAAPST